MTYEQVESFLAIVNCGNISAAAEYLYVSQSTISSRIQALENELDTPLLLRQKGVRAVELTPYGEAFIPIARQWAVLWRDTQNLRAMDAVQTLQIAGVNIITDYTFVPLFKRHMEQHPNIRLSIYTHHSNEIYQLVQSRGVDIGYAYTQSYLPDVISQPVYREMYCLICRADSPYYDGIAPEELDLSREVYQDWDQDYRQWHHSHWNPNGHPKITVNHGVTMRHYLDDDKSWALAPMSVARSVCRSPEFAWHRISDEPAGKICYQLTNRYASQIHAEPIRIFTEELLEFIEGDENVTPIRGRETHEINPLS